RHQHLRAARDRRRAPRLGERGVPRGRGAGPGQARHRDPLPEHARPAARGGGGPQRGEARHPRGRHRLPGAPVLARGAEARGEALLPPRLPGVRGPGGPGALPLARARHGGRGVRRLAEGAARALRGRRPVRPGLPPDQLRRTMRLALRRHSVLPGFGPTMGFTLLYLGLNVLLPLAALLLKTATLSWGDFWATVTEPRVLASYRLSFGASLLGALLNALFGFVVAWVLVRCSFPGKRLIDALVDLPFALPTAVSGIALTAIFAPNGWVGRWLEPLGVRVAFTWVGVVLALTLIGLPF